MRTFTGLCSLLVLVSACHAPRNEKIQDKGEHTSVSGPRQFPETIAHDQARPVGLIKRLDGGTRAKVLAALAGLIILGFAAVLLAWLGARVTQRYRKGSWYFRPTSRPGEHDWARKRLLAIEKGRKPGGAENEERG